MKRTAGSIMLLSLAVLVVIGRTPASAEGEESEESNSVEYALQKPLAVESLLLDGARAGDLLVAVGERGHILRSHDQGKTWTQADSVPTRATLTAVFLHDEELGWAVGHDATVLRTRDGAVTWELLYSAPEEELPLLDIWFRDAENGFVVGAYGYFLTTSNGGDEWSRADFSPESLEEEEGEVEDDPYAYEEITDYHLNHLALSDSGRLYIAAEAGNAYRSDDEGASWIQLPSPYDGSFFSSLPLDGDSLLLFGLRGHLFRSDDAGETWQELDSGTQAILTDGTRLGDGTIVIAGLEGSLLVSRDGGSTFGLKPQADRQGYSSVLPLGDGGVLLFGELGTTILSASVLGAD